MHLGSKCSDAEKAGSISLVKTVLGSLYNSSIAERIVRSRVTPVLAAYTRERWLRNRHVGFHVEGAVPIPGCHRLMSSFTAIERFSPSLNGGSVGTGRVVQTVVHFSRNDAQ